MTKTYDAQKTATEARQASPRKTNLRVLVLSLLGVVVLFGIIYMVFIAGAPPAGTTTGV